MGFGVIWGTLGARGIPWVMRAGMSKTWNEEDGKMK